MRMPNNRLLTRRARLNSFLHHAEPSHALLIRNSTASHRCAASLSARSQRSPAAIPRSGSRSRNRSSQPSPTSQSRSAMAGALSVEECEMNIRDTGMPPADLTSMVTFIGRVMPCHRIDWRGGCWQGTCRATLAEGDGEALRFNPVPPTAISAQFSWLPLPPAAAVRQRSCRGRMAAKLGS